MGVPSRTSSARWPSVSDQIEAQVQLQGRPVGTLLYEKGGSSFSYEDDLTAESYQTLGQIFEDDPRKRRSVRVGLPAWFENLLPEGELRKQITREMGGGYIKDFTLLLRLGSNLPGAVTVQSELEPPGDGIGEELNKVDLNHPIRHSLAGVQLKYSIHGGADALPCASATFRKAPIVAAYLRALRSLIAPYLPSECDEFVTFAIGNRVSLSSKR